MELKNIASKGPLLLKWINFNSSMNEYLRLSWNAEQKFLSILKL